MTPTPAEDAATPAKSREPSWLSYVNIGAGLPIAMVLVSGLVWAVMKGDKADTATAAAVTINARLDRLFEKIDIIATAMPVIQEKVANLEHQVTDGRGAYSTLDVRLRAIEMNTAAVHEEATTALKRTTVR